MSSIPRLFVTQNLAEGAAFPLDDAQANYLLRVLRLAADAPVRVFNGRDGEWEARIVDVHGKRASLMPDRLVRPQPDTPVSAPVLLFAPVKKAETDFIVEKATELGVDCIQPVVTEYTQTRTVRLDRFNKIALEAAEQTERLDLPEIMELEPLAHVLGQLPKETALIFCDEAGEDDTKPWGGETGRAGAALTILADLKKRDAAILIGPEGGFSPDERSALRARPETCPISLGPRILRAETAVISALTLWQSVCGDWA